MFDRWRSAIGIIAILGVLRASLAGVPVEARQSLRPDAYSPLALNSRSIFAVADERIVLSRPLDLSAPWTPLATMPDVIGGLAASDAEVFVSIPDRTLIFGVSATGIVRKVHEGLPLKQPTDLAFGRSLFIYERGGAIFRLDPSGAGGALESVDVAATAGGANLGYLAAAGHDVVIAMPQRQKLYDVRNADRPQFVTWRAIPQSNRDADGIVDTVETRDFPPIRNPDRVAIHAGVVYATQSTTGRLYAFSRSNPRPVRVVRSDADGTAGQQTVAVAVAADSMFLLDKSGELVRMGRIIPAEIELPLERVSEATAALYEYLYDRRILPVRELIVRADPAKKADLDYSLIEGRVVPAGGAAPLHRVLCRINRVMCGKSQQLPRLSVGDSIQVPDLQFERFVDTAPVELNGTTLNAKVAQLLPPQAGKDEFAEFRTEQRLRELNPSADGKAGPLGERTSGRFLVPIERFRYIAPIVADDAPPKTGPLATLAKTYDGLSIIALVERPASDQSGQAAAAEPDFGPLQKAFAHVMSLIGYDPASAAPVLNDPIKVGVAESGFDYDHPAFKNPKAPEETVWVPIEVGGKPQQRVDPKQLTPIRSLDDRTNDHGTAVAALIGARQFAFGGSGLAPWVQLVPIRSDESAIAEGVRKAVLRNAKLINISAHFDARQPPKLQERISGNPDTLFIVAAGNDVDGDLPLDEQKVCDQFDVFPACWASRLKNILVVTGTDRSGNALLPPAARERRPGANWHPEVVHIAAPADGFYAPGVKGSYVELRGTSFAAPLVSATAALLMSRGFQTASEIKERIIATADPIVGLNGRTRSGRLNVRRALTEPRRGRLISYNTSGAEETVVHLLPDLAPDAISEPTEPADKPGEVKTPGDPKKRVANDLRLTPPQGEDIRVPFHRVRRLHKFGRAYRLVYVDDQGELRVATGLEFPDRASAAFTCLKDGGKVEEFNFLDWHDYVGPTTRR